MHKLKFALLGSPPAFKKKLPVGQLYFPDWQRYESAMRGIFERRYYTNHGPLVQKFEAKLQEYLGVKHAICVTNATIGLIMAAEALELTRKVIVPAYTFIASVQSLSWAGLEPVFCDVDPHTHQMSVEKIEHILDENVTAIMGVNLWGGACDISKLQAFGSSHNLKLYFDSAHAFGCSIGTKKIGNFGELEVFSFHATKILSATEGGCVCTNDNLLAARLRNIRSSYGAGIPVPVVKTANGRMSEAQAAIALMSFEEFPKNQENNYHLFKLYKQYLQKIPGILLIEPKGVTFSNYQYVVCEVDKKIFGLSRDKLVMLLNAENIASRRYFYPPLHHLPQYNNGLQNKSLRLPVTEYLCESCMQLPIGQRVSEDAVKKICGIIERAYESRHQLISFFKGVHC